MELRVPVGAQAVSASLHGSGPTCVALAHGAGGDRRAALLVRLAEGLAASGRTALLHNFPYSEAGRRLPDPPALLEETTAAVAGFARERLAAERLVLGGKSMGGRIASQAVAKGLPAQALVFLGYPLHPPGKPHALRDRHLPGVAAPMLFVQGTRDAFARQDLLAALLGRLADRATLLGVPDGDHSFRVRKSSGWTNAEAEARVLEGVLRWLDAHGL